MFILKFVEKSVKLFSEAEMPMENFFFEKDEAIEFLVRIGVLIPFKDVKLYHGRTSRFDEPGKEWVVDPRFNNAGNNTGNYNVNSISVLSTAEFDVAKDFADSRNAEAYLSRGEKIDPKTSQVIRIASADPAAMIFNDEFKVENLPQTDRNKVYAALKALSTSRLTELAPIRFEDRSDGVMVFEAIRAELVRSGAKIVTDQILSKVKKDLADNGKSVSDKVLEQIGGAMNSRWLILRYPRIMFKKYALEKDEFKRTRIDDVFAEGFTGPLSLEYFASWCYSNHIIGQKEQIRSVTVGKNIDNYMIFDKSRINTEKAIGDKLRKIVKTFGEIDSLMQMIFPDSTISDALTNSSPSDSINFMAHRGFLEPYLLNTGVWEKFMIGEHTETVLRVFEDNFRDEIPESLVAPIKFIMLIHDIGKGYAVKDNKFTKQDEKNYTDKFCRNRVFKEFAIPSKMQDLLMFIIDESQVYAAKIYLPNASKEDVENSKAAMLASATKQLEKVLGRKPSKGEVMGLIHICKILLCCDGGAYTRYGITRDHATGIHYRNGNDKFTKSFKNPSDIRQREIRFLEKQ